MLNILLHLFFPAYDAHPRSLWPTSTKLSCHATIDPRGTTLDIESTKYLVVGRASQQITGNFRIHVDVDDDIDEGIGDALPSDLHKGLRCVALFECGFSPVKIVLERFIDAHYAEGAAYDKLRQGLAGVVI